MLTLSENLRLLINESNRTIYKLAKDAGIERTLIHKVLKGERVPSEDFVDKIAEALFLPPFERAKLQKSYEILKIGEFRYNQREQVKHLIELIAQVEKDNGSFMERISLPPTQRTVLRDYANSPAQVIVGQHAVNNIVKGVIEEETLKNEISRIDFIIPAKFQFFYDELSVNFLRDPTLNIRHIVELTKSGPGQGRENGNLTALLNIIKLVFVGGEGYAPYYVYSPASGARVLTATPYFIVTSRHVILLSEELDTAILGGNKDIIEYYSGFFRMALERATPLLHRVDSLYDLATYYLAIDRKGDSGTSCVIESEPCIGSYIREELIDKKLAPELKHREEIKTLVAKHFENMRRVASSTTGIFSIAGLDYLLETGHISGVPTSYYCPLDRGEIRGLILQYLGDVKQKGFSSFAVDPEKFMIPMFTSISIDKLSGVHFLTSTDARFGTLYINEHSMVEAFDDFCSSIVKSGLVYSREETIGILENYLSRL